MPGHLPWRHTPGTNKAALQAELALEVDPRIPLIGMVTRVDFQKGVDLVWPALEGIGESPWQFVFVGTGDPKLEQLCQAHAEKLPQRVRVVLRFDPPLARRIYAGSDMLLIPSRYEPCGLAQMIAMRYGSVPVVRATGGLLDSVKDLKSPGGGTGFVFQDPSFESLQQAIGRALEYYKQPQLWEQLQRNGMSQDFSWTQSARDYEKLYRRIGDLHAA